MNGISMTSSTIHARFAEQVERTPDAAAVSAAGTRLTYRELDNRANRLAHQLCGLGVGPEVPVAVLMERSADLVVAILAILKAGGFYLPLHEAYPLERMQFIVDQAGTPVLLTDRVMQERGVPSVEHVVSAENGAFAEAAAGESGSAPVRPADAAQLAYVIYTSGSTGQPKGVAVTHGDVLGLALDGCWDTGHHERVLMIAPYAFNVSTYELWVPLLHGGEIVVAPPGDLDLGVLQRLIAEHRITGIHLTAGLFRVVAEEAPQSLAGVREVLTGGDIIAPTAVRRVLETCPDLVVRAMYGATEVTLFSTHSAITAPYEPGNAVPVGVPMDEIQVHILDEHLTPVPNQVEGDVYISGRGVARGYFGHPDLTAERFVADPFGEPGRRMYRTGDLARWNDDRELEFIGRANDQVKIVGFRVETGEVEAVLATHPDLAHVAVVAKETSVGEKRLVAYVVTTTGILDAAALRSHVQASLPEYMTPSAFVAVDALPLTPNGKLDRRALPEPDFDSGTAYRAPQDPRQEAMCAIFADVLGVERVGIDDSIFDLGGGQSLTAMRLVSRIRSELGVDLSIDILFNAPTVAGLSGQLESGTAPTFA
jgi:amino acid adenylation domain-containing protein